MHKSEALADIEKSLQKLMPVSLSEEAQCEMHEMFDRLAAGSDRTAPMKSSIRHVTIWSAAAAIVAACFVFLPKLASDEGALRINENFSASASYGMEFLSEADRVEIIQDKGLYVDTGGSAVRKVRVRVVEERQIKDKETGIIVMLTEPREETYMIPVSMF
jgi:hypothetical protein